MQDDNHEIQSNAAAFLIYAVQDSDAGNYECEVNNRIGEALRRTFAVGELSLQMFIHSFVRSDIDSTSKELNCCNRTR